MTRDIRAWSKPINPKATASAFAEYVFANITKRRETQIGDLSSRRERQLLGKITHRNIELFLYLKWTKENLENWSPNDWSTFFVDEAVERPSRVFSASRLRIGEQSLQCVPDLVLCNRSSDQYLIVERKTTFVPEPSIPPNGWPNVEAQLWCYSWIDELIDASRVTLIGEYWHRPYGGGLTLVHTHSKWTRGEAVHEKKCAEMFSAYGGKIIE